MRHNRHIAALLCAAILMLFPAGCSEEQTARSPGDTLDSLIEQLTFSDQMTEMNADDACRFYNIDAELITDGAAYVGSGATAESLAVFQAADPAAAQTTADALQTFLDGWIDGYSDYDPEEVPKLESAILQQEGVYVILCVSADNDAAADIIDDTWN